jgi:hypothetical protein
MHQLERRAIEAMGGRCSTKKGRALGKLVQKIIVPKFGVEVGWIGWREQRVWSAFQGSLFGASATRNLN